MTLLSLARYFREKRVNGRFLSFVSFAQPVFLCEIIQPSCIRLRDQRNLRENNHAKSTQSIGTNETLMSLVDYTDNPLNPQQLQTVLPCSRSKQLSCIFSVHL